MSLQTGDFVTVMLRGHVRRGTARRWTPPTLHFNLEAEPALGLARCQGVVLVETEGTMWIRGWADEEAAGALAAASALVDLTGADEALLLETMGFRRT